ncbi:MAG: hypothetical protein QXQ68_05875 [Candidatus Nitrosocaldaceae archaeon]
MAINLDEIELSVEEMKKIREVSANVIKTAATATLRQEHGSEKIRMQYDFLVRKLEEDIVNADKSELMDITFSKKSDLPPEITAGVVAAYSSVINARLDECRKRILEDAYYLCPIQFNSRKYMIIYSVDIDTVAWRQITQEQEPAIYERALPLDLIITYAGIVHKPTNIDIGIGRSYNFRIRFFLYDADYDYQLMKEADRIYAEILAWKLIMSNSN